MRQCVSCTIQCAKWTRRSDRSRIMTKYGMDRETLLKSLAEYTFYQTIDLGERIETPGRPVGPKQRQVLEFIESTDLDGKRVVDLGCANGLFALAAERQGAREVVAVDHTKKNIESLENVIIPRLNSNISPVHLNVMDFESSVYGRFDVVVFAGLLYHLRYPFAALRMVRDLLPDGGRLILETGIIEDFNLNSVLYCPSPDESPQKGRGGNACSFFNERGLRRTLGYFGLKVRSQVVTTSCLRRLAKKVYRKRFRGYRISNAVLCCERDRSTEDRGLTEFYEATTA